MSTERSTFDATEFDVPRRKRPNLVAEEIKGWIVRKQMRPGDHLPNEKQLMTLFGVSKGTMRECLQSLEMQGIVRINTGPRGGPLVAEVPYTTSAELLSNYFYFRNLDADRLYQVRQLLEPELAASAVPFLGEDKLAILRRSVEICSSEALTAENRREQRIEELRFHDVLAECCPNPLLSFTCKFINDLLARKVVFKSISATKQEEIRKTNARFHREIYAAAAEQNAEVVRRMMHEHMIECKEHARLFDATVDPAFLKF